MKRMTRWATYGSVLLMGLALLAVSAARAEGEPDTGVARVSLIRGDVLMTRGDSGDQVATKVNSPLVHGDRIMTGEKSQAEIQLDHSNVIRLAPSSEIRIADLTRKQIQIQVAQGLVHYTVFKSNEADIEIDTPNMAVRPIKEGFYRIQVTSPTETQLIVRKGDADVTTPEGTTRVEDGRVIMVRGSDNPEYQIAKAPGRDDWDKWNKDRDDTIKDSKSYKYANNYYTGAHDLDRNGRWVYDSSYGDWCWTPYVNAGWVPYRDGYWGWQPYWGWTWISYEPWGWAPYHYGRWFNRGASWYWWPGRHSYGYYPTWGPAYVSFLGFGYGSYNWGFGFGYGYSSIGWCPLGPYDRGYSWWGGHNSYNAVNITNITNITNVTNIQRGGRGHDQFGRGGNRSNLQAALTDSNVRGGITRVSTNDFMRGNFSRAQRGLDANTLREGQLVQGRIPVAPTRETLRPVDNSSRTSRASGSDSFFSRRQPPAVNRNFNEQAGAVQDMMRTHNAAAGAAGGREGAAGRNATSGSSAASRGSSDAGGFGRGRETSATRTGAPAEKSGAVTARQGESRGSAGQTGWARFGQPGTRGEGSRQGESEIAQRTAPATRPSGQQGQAAPQQDRTWRRFGTGQPRALPDRPTTTGAPQGTQPATGRTGQAGSGNTSRTTQGERGTEAPAPRIEGGYTPSQQRGESGAAPSSGGWRRFGSRSDNTGGSDRPALDIRKSITTERAAPRTFERGQSGGGEGNNPPSTRRGFDGGGRPAPRSFERGGSNGGQRGNETTTPSSSPRNFQGSSSAAPRSFERGGGSSYPSGGGAAPRSFERSGPSGSYGGGGGSSSGGNRGGSAPSGGGARSAPSGSYGGGGGSRGGWSAPSGGGGGRGASAPSGGGGGGRSAPSSGGGRSPSSTSSSRGGNSGRR